MTEKLNFRIVWDRHDFPQQMNRHFYSLQVEPSAQHPFGQKGAVLLNAWKQLSLPTTQGIILLDSDVIIDPDMYMKMETAVHNFPDEVHTAPVKIWPVSTKHAVWCWGHWSNEKNKSQVMETEDVKWFSFNFTYLPRKVIEKAISDGLKDWKYPVVDKNVAISANKIGVKVSVLKDCFPVHLNY
jgi:hypothetical protein